MANVRTTRVVASEPWKYPRTPHLPWSPGFTGDDVRLADVAHLECLRDVVVTEKLDGENTTFLRDRWHARSPDSRSHPSRDWVARLHATVAWRIPPDMRVCGENVFARHSIFYDKLTSYFYVFAVLRGETFLPWDEVLAWCQKLGLEHVPVLYRGPWDEEQIRSCWRGRSAFGEEQEGYVVRNAQAFSLDDFARNVAKFVRSGHVVGDSHWMRGPLVRNRLARDAERT
jgi:hypothetical protein